MVRLLLTCLRSLRAALSSRRDLVLENLALRQQLATLRVGRRPVLQRTDRAFWVLLHRYWSGWADALAIVKPATVVRWHRAGFQAFWYRRSRATRGRPRTDRRIAALVRRMAAETLWGATRIHGELLKLGFSVSERTVSRLLERLPRLSGPGRQTWTTFLRNHRADIAAMDLVTVPTATFRLLYALVIVRHGRREVVRCGVTSRPNATWIVQQLREAFPFDSAPRFLIHDRDNAFQNDVQAALRSLAITPVRTSFRSPWQNGVAERFIGTLRRELLDHVIVLGERHLRGLIDDYVAYYNLDRTHLAAGKDSPSGRPVELRPEPGAKVVSLPRVGGLHRRYAWRRAA